MLFTAARTPL